MTSAPSSIPSAETVALWRSRIREDALANHALCMGLAIQGGGAPADAVPFLRRALSHSALRAESWFALVQALREAGQPAEAAAAEAEALRENPGFVLAAQVRLARYLMETPVTPVEKVRAFLIRAQAIAVEAGSRDVQAHLLLLQMLFLCRLGHGDQLEEVCHGLTLLDGELEKRVELGLLAVELARALVRAGQVERARQVLELTVRRLDLRVLSGSDLVALEVPLVQALAVDWDSAIVAILLDIADQDPVSPLASFLSSLGGVAIRQGDLALAARACEAAFARAPDNRRVRRIYPVYLINQGRVSEGLAQLAAASADGIVSDRALRLPARILHDRQDYQGVLSVLQIGLARRSASKDLLDLKGYTLLNMGEMDKVQDLLTDSAIYPETKAKILASMEMRAGRWAEAVSVLAAAREADPRSPYPDLLTAIALLGAGDGAGMLAALAAADRIKRIPDIVDTLRGAALRLTGQPAPAVRPAALQAALSFVSRVCPGLTDRLSSSVLP